MVKEKESKKGLKGLKAKITSRKLPFKSKQMTVDLRKNEPVQSIFEQKNVFFQGELDTDERQFYFR